MIYIDQLKNALKSKRISEKIYFVLRDFYQSYLQATQNVAIAESKFKKLLERVVFLAEHPYQFSFYHQAVRSPFDYTQYGMDFIRELVDFSHSNVKNLPTADIILHQIKKNENVILLANHQTEADPQIISLLLEKTHPELLEKFIFVAGHRVIEDPIAIPFSLGCNLLCIFSKKHISNPPEEKEQKILHNQKTMKKMEELLREGGKCIYIAPSGGRDRANAEGVVEVTTFDPQSLEMFKLMAEQARTPVHFYPLALKTYQLLPPPSKVEKDIGERRTAFKTPVHMAFGPEIFMEDIPGTENLQKKEKRIVRSDYIWKLVVDYYAKI